MAEVPDEALAAALLRAIGRAERGQVIDPSTAARLVVDIEDHIEDQHRTAALARLDFTCGCPIPSTFTSWADVVQAHRPGCFHAPHQQ